MYSWTLISLAVVLLIRTISQNSVEAQLSDDSTCNLSLCNMLATVLTCPALNVSGMPMICAKYLLGGEFDCPSPEFYTPLTSAPYICKSYYYDIKGSGLLGSPSTTLEAASRGLEKAATTLQLQASTISPLGYDNFTELCAQECFYKLLVQLNDVITDCGSSTVSLMSSVDHFQRRLREVKHGRTLQSSLTGSVSLSPILCEFCARNPITNSTCLDYTSSFTSGGTISSIPFTCPFPSAYLPAVQAALCATLSPLGCCFGQFVGFAQELSDTVLPPCILELVRSCDVKSTTLCTAGSAINASVVTGSFSFVQSTALPSILPNMWNETQVRRLMNASAEAVITIADSVDQTVNVKSSYFTFYSFDYRNESGHPITSYTEFSCVTNATYYFQFDLFYESAAVTGDLLELMFQNPVFGWAVATELGIINSITSSYGTAMNEFFLAEPNPLTSASARSQHVCVALGAILAYLALVSVRVL